MKNVRNNEKIQRIGVSALIKNDKDEILIVSRSQTDSMPGIWETPGGGLEWGENPRDAVKREVKEEVGLDVEVKNLLDIISYISKKNTTDRHIVQIYFEADLLNSDQEVMLSSEHAEFRWIKPQDLTGLYKSFFLEKLSSQQ